MQTDTANRSQRRRWWEKEGEEDKDDEWEEEEKSCSMRQKRGTKVPRACTLGRPYLRVGREVGRKGGGREEGNEWVSGAAFETAIDMWKNARR